MILEEYKNLPDRIPIEKLQSMFEDVLTKFKQDNLKKDEFLDIINELMDRQVMSYEVLEDNIRNNLDVAICNLWNTDSYADVDVILSIVVNLGLNKCYKMIRESIKNNKVIDKQILAEVLDTIEENGEDISNPYRNLERFK